MKILIGCEYSGTVRDAFLARGHDAISCDLLPSDSLGIEITAKGGEKIMYSPHYQGDIYNMLNQKWDLIIAHPPCTYLAVCANKWYGEGKLGYHKRLNAASWTKNLWDACIRQSDKVCFENPVSVLARLAGLPKAAYVQPYGFGHLEQKKTGLHLHNLPALVETDNVYDEMMKLPKNVRERLHYLPPSPDRWKIRSTFYKGIAAAMADQWGDL